VHCILDGPLSRAMTSRNVSVYGVKPGNDEQSHALRA